MAFASFLAFVFFAAVGGYLNVKFMKRLRVSHPDVWQRLGSPDYWNQSIKNNWMVLRFILKREFRSLEDPELVKLCEHIRLFDIIFFISFGSWIIFAFLWSIYVGPF